MRVETLLAALILALTSAAVCLFLAGVVIAEWECSSSGSNDCAGDIMAKQEW